VSSILDLDDKANKPPVVDGFNKINVTLGDCWESPIIGSTPPIFNDWSIIYPRSSKLSTGAPFLPDITN